MCTSFSIDERPDLQDGWITDWVNEGQSVARRGQRCSYHETVTPGMRGLAQNRVGVLSALGSVQSKVMSWTDVRRDQMNADVERRMC